MQRLSAETGCDRDCRPTQPNLLKHAGRWYGSAGALAESPEVIVREWETEQGREVVQNTHVFGSRNQRAKRCWSRHGVQYRDHRCR
jgi:hypothetical protein